MRSVLLFI